MSKEIEEAIEKLKHVKSNANKRLKSAFIAGFLASNDKFNAQSPYSMQEEWFKSEESDIERKLETAISQLSIDLDEDYKKFLKNKTWYHKKLSNSNIDIIVNRKRLSY